GRAIWTSGEPVSDSLRRCCFIISVVRSFVIAIAPSLPPVVSSPAVVSCWSSSASYLNNGRKSRGNGKGAGRLARQHLESVRSGGENVLVVPARFAVAACGLRRGSTMNELRRIGIAVAAAVVVWSAGARVGAGEFRHPTGAYTLTLSDGWTARP